MSRTRTCSTFNIGQRPGRKLETINGSQRIVTEPFFIQKKRNKKFC